MLDRYSIKIGGQSGTGINTVGTILSKALKRSGFYCVSYREYPSLIKGGFASYKIDFSDKEFNSVSKKTNLFVAIDKWSFEHLIEEVDNQDIFIYDKNLIRVSEEQQKIIDEKQVRIFDLPLTLTAKQVGGNTIMKNTVLMGALWNLLALDSEILNSSIINVFNKTKEIEDANVACANAGKEMLESDESILTRFKISEKPKEKISISGNEAMALGAYAAGVRAYFAYPMTPSSPVLQTISHFASKTGIIVKQAEDEITAVNMVIGANHAGTRAMCGTSGGGFDLMTEALSLSGITETPLVVILAQRPGPATGAPTWTAQGDLNLAIFAGHGQFLRIVLAPGDNQESFEMIAEAHNLAEKFQTPVIIMNDKYLGETLYTTDPFSSESITIDRGEILENPTPESMRYQFTESGISPRWFPGTPGNTFVGNSDEHDEKGHSVEDADKVEAMISKRIKKESTAHSIIPEPEYFGSENAETVFIGWGSTKHIMLDAMKENPDKIGFLYFKYISPLRKEKLIELKDKGKKFVAIENNEKGHFADYIQMQTGIMIPERILKFDGRPFFIEEVVEKISNI